MLTVLALLNDSWSETAMSRGVVGFAVEQQPKTQRGSESGKRHQLLAEHYRAQALRTWLQAAQTSTFDTHRYWGQAVALKEQAARSRFPEIRVRLLAIAERYEYIADFFERAAAARPFGCNLSRNPQKLRDAHRAG
jgi:hypothetical protein